MCALILGCSGGEAIVSRAEPVWTADEAWTVDATPVVSIGEDRGDEPYLLSQVGGALRLSDGRIVLSNAGSGELRFFDAEGKYLASVGRQGQGPGEFGRATDMHILADSNEKLFVEDVGQRVHAFTPDGEYLETIMVDPEPGAAFASPLGIFEDGSWLVYGTERRAAERPSPGTVLQRFLIYSRYRDGRAVGGPIASLEGRRRYVHQYGDVTHNPFLPFDVDPSVVALGNRMYAIPSGDAVIQVYDQDGQLLRSHRLTHLAPRRTEDYWPRFREEAPQMIPAGGPQNLRERYAHFYGQDLPLREFLPAYQNALVDQERNLWLERFRLPWETAPVWDVVTEDGDWLGSVELPVGLYPFQITDRFIVGRSVDEAGTARVVLHALNK